MPFQKATIQFNNNKKVLHKHKTDDDETIQLN